MSADKHSDDLALFQPPVQETATQKREWITVRPINQLTDGAAIEFNIPGTSLTYIDLKNLLLHVKLKVVKANGSDIATSDKTGLTNNPLHSIFSQVDVNLQQHPTSDVGANYAYKAYLDTLLECRSQHELDCLLFIKDDPLTDMDDGDPSGENNGLFEREKFTSLSKEIELIGKLHVDLCQQDRLILNGVPLNVKLWQSPNTFRLMAKDTTENYKVVITEAALKVATVKVDPHVILGQADILKKSEALYPYTRSVIKTYAVPKGQFSFITDDLFQGEVPQQLTVGLVESASVHGSYVKNPFNFQHFNCSYAGFFVDGQSTPSEPLQPNYTNGHFVEAYKRLFWNPQHRAIHISKTEFKGGYCLYVFRPSGDTEDRPEERAHTRLELKFSAALPETCTVIVYAKFPALMRIDANRRVTLD